MNNETCIHGGISPVSLLENLHNSQAGSGRHRCPICAYEQGFTLGSTKQWGSYEEYCATLTDGEKCQMGSIAPTSILINLGENQGGTGRHKCTNCAFKQGFLDSINEDNINILKLELVPTPNHKILKSKKNNKAVKDFDLIKKEIENKQLGLLGELFIIEQEKQFLIKNGKENLSKLIEHSSKEIGDGLGYDIISYDLDGNKKYIEVKTTRSEINRPFYLTKNEIEFSKDNKEFYYLYRIFDFDANLHSGRYYQIKGDLNVELNLEPVLYIAIPK